MQLLHGLPWSVGNNARAGMAEFTGTPPFSRAQRRWALCRSKHACPTCPRTGSAGQHRTACIGESAALVAEVANNRLVKITVTVAPRTTPFIMVFISSPSLTAARGLLEPYIARSELSSTLSARLLVRMARVLKDLG